MKRDMDVVRAILLKAESMDEPAMRREIFELEGHSTAEVARYLLMMREAGLIDANILDLPEADGAVSGRLLRITWWGHDFLDLARDEAGWKKAIDAVAQKVGGVPLEILTEYLKARARGLLGLGEGEQ